MSVPLKELGSKLSYQEVNDMLKLYASNIEPESPFDGQIWLDTSQTPNRLKRYNNGSAIWDTVGDMTAADILNDIKTVDGSGSGLDADTVDGIESSAFVRCDTDSSINSNTQWQNSQKVKLGNADDAEFYSDGSNVYLQLNKNNGNLIFKLNGVSQVVEIQGTMTGSPGLHSDHPQLRLTQLANQEYNLGDVHGELQFYTYDTGGDFPGIQAFIKTVTTRSDGISCADAGFSFGTSYNCATAVETMCLDGEGNMFLPQDTTIYIGAGKDLILRHDGTNTYLKNNANNGSDLYVQNESYGEKIIMTCKDTSGTEKNLLSLDPETEEVSITGNKIWHAGNDGPGSGLDADTFDGEQSSYYRDASNLNTGTVARARLSDLGNVSNPYICAGKTNITSDLQNVSFGTSFTNTPYVVASPDESRLVRIVSVSTTGFQVKRTLPDYPNNYTFDAGYIYWIAFGNKV